MSRILKACNVGEGICKALAYTKSAHFSFYVLNVRGSCLLTSCLLWRFGRHWHDLTAQKWFMFMFRQPASLTIHQFSCHLDQKGCIWISLQIYCRLLTQIFFLFLYMSKQIFETLRKPIFFCYFFFCTKRINTWGWQTTELQYCHLTLCLRREKL